MQTVWSRGPWLEPSGARAPPLSEKSLYFLFPFKFPLSLWSLMTICQRLNVGSNLLLPLEEIHLLCFDGCQMVHTKGDQAQKQNCISRSSVRRLINNNQANKKNSIFKNKLKGSSRKDQGHSISILSTEPWSSSIASIGSLITAGQQHLLHCRVWDDTSRTVIAKENESRDQSFKASERLREEKGAHILNG